MLPLVAVSGTSSENHTLSFLKLFIVRSETKLNNCSMNIMTKMKKSIENKKLLIESKADWS